MLAKLLYTALIALLAPLSAMAAQVVVVPGDPAGQGFNDPTPATPVGGNPGTTVGQQALNVFQRAADLWGAKLQSDQPILVIAFFTPLDCTPTAGVLGAAGANWYFSDIPPANGGKALEPNTWYPAALAEKITRQDIVADPNDPFEIFAVFNNQLGTASCLTSSGWYYGLDNREPANRIDLLAVVLHEMGHGLGFAAGPTSGNNGARALGQPSVWERHMFDLTANKRWLDMSNAERAASARNDGNLVWIGNKATNNVTSVLDFRTEVKVVRPASLGTNEAQAAQFGPGLSGNVPLAGTLVAPTDGGGASLLDGCDPYSAGTGFAGRIVLVNRGNCTFNVKVLNAQNAGAGGVLVANNVSAGYPSMGGDDPAVTIPSAGITQALGNALRASLASSPDVYVEIQRNVHVRAGTTGNLPRLYAPRSFAGGSSVSHWDVTATPNLLMEPFINTNLGSSVKNPSDLTRGLFVDIGW